MRQAVAQKRKTALHYQHTQVAGQGTYQQTCDYGPLNERELKGF
jgi:hypothetical protein